MAATRALLLIALLAVASAQPAPAPAPAGAAAAAPKKGKAGAVHGFIRTAGNKFVDADCGDFIPFGWNSELGLGEEWAWWRRVRQNSGGGIARTRGEEKNAGREVPPAPAPPRRARPADPHTPRCVRRRRRGPPASVRRRAPVRVSDRGGGRRASWPPDNFRRSRKALPQRIAAAVGEFFVWLPLPRRVCQCNIRVAGVGWRECAE